MSDALKIITLTTDFGYRDSFVGEMKGVIFSINSSANLVDITHGITPHNIDEGAFVVGSAYRYFPQGTIHVAVVDPGVGSDRRSLIIEAGGHFFVGPDNGIFSYVLRGGDFRAAHITNEKYIFSKDSPTFQGRDIFAPAAAWLSTGVSLVEFGPDIKDLKRLNIPEAENNGNIVRGSVIYIDRFGNAITNIMKKDLAVVGEDFSVEINGTVVRPAAHYSQAIEGELTCLVNSSGYLELFVNLGSAAALFGIKKGDKLVVSSN